MYVSEKIKRATKVSVVGERRRGEEQRAERRRLDELESENEVGEVTGEEGGSNRCKAARVGWM